MTTPTPDELRARAEALFDAQHPRRGRRNQHEEAELIGEIPVMPGQVLRVERQVGKPNRSGHRRSYLSFRSWVIEPRGDRFPTNAGFTISCEALPHLATAIATALQLEIEALPAWTGLEPRR
jgi:hypothetical protein